jgi:hypothetical protein
VPLAGGLVAAAWAGEAVEPSAGALSAAPAGAAGAAVRTAAVTEDAVWIGMDTEPPGAAGWLSLLSAAPQSSQ